MFSIMTTKCATVALLGVPNSGKSTLLNSILGMKLAAVHRKVQMTRKNQLGIHTEHNCQLVFIDTPGIHHSDKALNKKMLGELRTALAGADIVLVLIEAQRSIPAIINAYLTDTQGSTKNIIVVNKTDEPKTDWQLDPEVLKQQYGLPVILISARQNTGIQDLIKFLQEGAPKHPFFYDADDLTTTSMRDIAADCIREKLMEYLHDEIPYETGVVVEEYQEGKKKIKIKATIMVNHKSQKGIVIGHKGENIAKIRQAAERDFGVICEKFVSLQLFVKVDDGWIKDGRKVDEYVF